MSSNIKQRQWRFNILDALLFVFFDPKSANIGPQEIFFHSSSLPIFIKDKNRV